MNVLVLDVCLSDVIRGKGKSSCLLFATTTSSPNNSDWLYSIEGNNMLRKTNHGNAGERTQITNSKHTVGEITVLMSSSRAHISVIRPLH